MKGHNLCIYEKLRKLSLNYPCYPFLSGALHIGSASIELTGMFPYTNLGTMGSLEVGFCHQYCW